MEGREAKREMKREWGGRGREEELQDSLSFLHDAFPHGGLLGSDAIRSVPAQDVKLRYRALSPEFDQSWTQSRPTVSYIVLNRFGPV